MDQLALPVCSDTAAGKKKRRTLRDAEEDLSTCRNALQEAKRTLVLTVGLPDRLEGHSLLRSKETICVCVCVCVFVCAVCILGPRER